MIKAVFDVLVTPQTDNIIEDNIIRKIVNTPQNSPRNSGAVFRLFSCFYFLNRAVQTATASMAIADAPIVRSAPQPPTAMRQSSFFFRSRAPARVRIATPPSAIVAPQPDLGSSTGGCSSWGSSSEGTATISHTPVKWWIWSKDRFHSARPCLLLSGGFRRQSAARSRS